jgi:hypothetical protein
METDSLMSEMISTIEETKRICTACAHGLVGKPKLCYACENDLVGMPKNDHEEWECRCTDWECQCDANETELSYNCYCIFCERSFSGSSYLATQIADPKQLWLANMITHYRHSHRKSWDAQWKYIESHCAEGVYEETKRKTNNQIKRKMLRSKPFMTFAREHGIDDSHFLSLLDNEEATLELVEKKFGTKISEEENA